MITCPQGDLRYSSEQKFLKQITSPTRGSPTASIPGSFENFKTFFGGIMIVREKKMVDSMVHLYCHLHQHDAMADGGLCESCDSMNRYAQARLSACPFGDQKSTCKNCTVHCYRKDQRNKMREMMRYAGPRMLWHHPIMALQHKVDGLRKALPISAVKKAFSSGFAIKH